MSFLKTVLSVWPDPPAIYRSMTFWSWNEKLSPERLRRQIASMHRAGMGGFFMHSRYGLKTTYLSDEWFECVSACIEEARQRGLKACLYDEDRWPSGSAGGSVTRLHPEFRMRYLEAAPPAFATASPSREALLAVRLAADGGLVSWREVNRTDAPLDDGERVLAFDAVVMPCTARFNDGTPLDSLNPAAVAAFIRSTYDVYADRCGQEFGKVIPTIFTDEPHYFKTLRVPARQARRVPWTDALPAEFLRRRGYDVRRHLPELFFDRTGVEFSPVRHDFYRTLTELFVESYSAQIGNWCRSHHIAFTGHYLSEQSLNFQTDRIGAAMPHYEHQDWPGIDLLTDSDSELNTAKQCSSVAEQLGKERVLSELYGVTGWDWPLEGHKFIGDWQYACGVNLRCPHLSWYSAAGGGKRDYPASIFDHSPWWKHYRTVEDYFGRLSFWLTQGRAIRDVLLIHPVESAWGAFRASENHGDTTTSPLQEPLDRITSTLTGEHLDWDFGDESLLARHGKVTAAGFEVGKMTYRLVIVPPCFTLRATTVALLRKHLAAGGAVLFIGRPPTRIDCTENASLGALVTAASACGEAVDQFLPAIGALLPRRLSIVEEGAEQRCLWTMLRHVPGGQVLFVQSHDRKAGHGVRVRVQGSGPVVLWDALNGRITQVPFEGGDGTVVFSLDLPPTGSALVTLGLTVPQASGPVRRPRVLATEALPGPYEISLAEPNTMPLDFCQYRMGDAAFGEPMPTLKAEAEIRKALGLSIRSNSGAQPWYLSAAGKIDATPRGRCELRYTFHVTEIPIECKLALERPQDYRVTVNGRQAGAAVGWWLDEDIRTLDVTALLATGENEILLTFDYRSDMELEDLYLVGSFGVAPFSGEALMPGNVTLVRPPTALRVGSWIGQGLSFYGGAVHYCFKVVHPGPGKGLRVRLPGIDCTAAAVYVAGKCRVLPWAPFEVDITGDLIEGENEVTVEVIGGRKNIMGPLHVPWEPWTSPNHFMTSHANWRKDYILNDHGLMQPVVVETVECPRNSSTVAGYYE